MVDSFHNERLPENIEIGARGGLGFLTHVNELNDGSDQRNIEWSQAKGRWDISYGARDKEDIDAVKTFHLTKYGKAIGFRFRDWTDYIMPRQAIGTGNGTQTSWPVYKLYQTPAGNYYQRYLTRLVDGSVFVWVNGVQQGISDYSIDLNTGDLVITPAVAGGLTVEFACQFDVPVNFDVDRLDIQAIKVEDRDVDDVSPQTEGLEVLGPTPIVEIPERLDI